MKVICPYCNSVALLKDASVVYFRTGYGQIYQCPTPECDAYVGVHTGTIKPKGSLANSHLRNLRKSVHAVFDPLWKNNTQVKRGAVYTAAARVLGLKEFHIGDMRDKDAQNFIDTKDLLIQKINKSLESKKTFVQSRRQNVLKILRNLHEASTNSDRPDFVLRQNLGDVSTIQACVDSKLATRHKKSVTKETFYILTANGRDALGLKTK